MLKLSKSSVYNMLHTGQLRGRRWGKRWVVPSEALDEFLGVNHEVPDEFPEPDSGNGSESRWQMGVDAERLPVAEEGIPEEEPGGRTTTIEWAIDVIDQIVRAYPVHEQEIIVRFVSSHVEGNRFVHEHWDAIERLAQRRVPRRPGRGDRDE